jgi:leucine dehydrogenase
MWSYDDARSAVGDALRLSRAMTLKAAVAGLPLGGGKGVIMTEPGMAAGSRRRREALLDFADTVDSLQGRYVTAEDVGTSSRDMSLISERTPHVAGLARRRGGSGDPSSLTAFGVEVAIRTALRHAFGSDSLEGRRVVVIGLGHVGSRLARRCARSGAELRVADVDERKRALAAELRAGWIDPERALQAEADVIVPCALGGVLNDASVARLRCRVIAGAANNQLAEDRIAEVLQSRGILWAPDFVCNAGGIINIAEELGGYDPAAARRRAAGIGDTLAQIFARAERERITPLQAALDLAQTRLAAPLPREDAPPPRACPGEQRA